MASPIGSPIAPSFAMPPVSPIASPIVPIPSNELVQDIVDGSVYYNTSSDKCCAILNGIKICN
jgi:hypothetical protein